MRSGNRAYSRIERKSRRREARPANKTALSKVCRRSMKDKIRALWLKDQA